MDATTYRRSSRRRASGALVSAALCAPLLLAGAPAAHAAAQREPGVSAAGSFSGKASAEGIRSRVAVTDFLIFEDLVDGGGPAAQAALDSVGESTAFASVPYPGELVVSAPGLIGVATGRSVPGYPFFVSSQHPSDPKKDVDVPGYRLHAASTLKESAAEAQTGVTGQSSSRGTAAARVASSNGDVVANAESTSEMQGEAFTLSRTRSTARVVRAASGKVTRTSSLEVGELSVGGVDVGVYESGLVVGGTTIPLNGLDTVTDVVARGGVTVRFLPATRSKNGIVSAGLEITTSSKLPNGAVAKVTHVVGRSSASAEATTFGTATTSGATTSDRGPSTAPSPAGPSAGSEPTVDPGTDAAAPVTGAGPPVASSGSTAPSAPDVASDTGGSATQGEPLSLDVREAASVPLPRLSFYPVLVLGALLLIGSSVGARRITKAEI